MKKLLLGITTIMSLSVSAFPDYNKNCVEYLNDNFVDCEGKVTSDSVPKGECTVPIVLKNKQNGEIRETHLYASSLANGGAGIVNWIGVGLIHDVPSSLVQKNKARSKLNAKIEIAKKNLCSAKVNVARYSINASEDEKEKTSSDCSEEKREAIAVKYGLNNVRCVTGRSYYSQARNTDIIETNGSHEVITVVDNEYYYIIPLIDKQKY